MTKMTRTFSNTLPLAMTLFASMAGNAAPSEKVRSPGTIIAESEPSAWRTLNPEHAYLIDLPTGQVIFEVNHHIAPGHAKQMQDLVKANFYQGLSFYRVIDGFVAQGGDVAGTRREATEFKAVTQPIKAEFTQAKSALPHFTLVDERDGYAGTTGFAGGFPVALEGEQAYQVHCEGALGMARGNEADSGSTEIYFALSHSTRYLDKNITVFGQVVSGMKALQALTRTEDFEKGAEPNHIERFVQLSSLPKEAQLKVEVMRTDSADFKEYIKARKNRPSEWFIHTPDYVDVCSVRLPVKVTKAL